METKLETTKRLCLRNKWLRRFKGHENIKCYNHKIHGWIVLADNVFYCEDKREMTLEEVRNTAAKINPARAKDWLFLQEVFYIKIIKKDLTEEQWLEEHQRILDWQKRDEKANLNFIQQVRTL